MWCNLKIHAWAGLGIRLALGPYNVKKSVCVPQKYHVYCRLNIGVSNISAIWHLNCLPVNLAVHSGEHCDLARIMPGSMFYEFQSFSHRYQF